MTSATPPLRTRLRRFVRFLLLRVALSVARLLPLPVASGLGRHLGALAWVLARGERRKALASLRTAFPESPERAREALGRACFEHLGRTALELVRVDALDARRQAAVEWADGARATLDAALAAGRGVVFVTGHCGNWELLARSVALEGYPVSVVGKETSDRRTTRLVEDFRASGHMHVIWRGAPGAARALLRTLKSNGLLGLLIDQDTRVQSVWVPFFGRPAKTPRAAADLVLRTGAAPVLGFCTRVAPLKYRLTIEALPRPEGTDEAASVALTAAFTRGIEAQIRAHPEQWVWMHERWKSPPEPAV